MSGRRDNGNNDGCSGGLALILLGIILLPLTGIHFMISGQSKGYKIFGIVLFVVGLVIWGVIGFIGS
ncbi:MAG: hypothetical protein PUA83_01280 [Clostridiales bacterium]|nr:hypothetical protein [Clostridiales bacterium]